MCSPAKHRPTQASPRCKTAAHRREVLHSGRDDASSAASPPLPPFAPALARQAGRGRGCVAAHGAPRSRAAAHPPAQHCPNTYGILAHMQGFGKRRALLRSIYRCAVWPVPLYVPLMALRSARMIMAFCIGAAGSHINVTVPHHRL